MTSTTIQKHTCRTSNIIFWLVDIQIILIWLTRFLNIGVYPNFLWLYKDYLPQLRSQLVFHDHLLQSVKQWKTNLTAESSKEIVFVGVHNRRTDYANHLSVVNAGNSGFWLVDTSSTLFWLAGATLVDQRFFDKAFQIYRDKFNNDRRQVMFLAVSDDNQWIKVTLHSLSKL